MICIFCAWGGEMKELLGARDYLLQYWCPNCGATFAYHYGLHNGRTWKRPTENREEECPVHPARYPFVVGNEYRWIGDPERPEVWNQEGKMDAMLDGQWRRCTGLCGDVRAYLEGIDEDWCWTPIDFFVTRTPHSVDAVEKMPARRRLIRRI